jgi:hypothetical protein
MTKINTNNKNELMNIANICGFVKQAKSKNDY